MQPSSIVVKKFTNEESIPWAPILDGALQFNHHLPSHYVENRLASVRSRVDESDAYVVVAYQDNRYAGHMFYSKQRDNVTRIALGGVDARVAHQQEAIFDALLACLHNLDGEQDLVCGAPESMLEGFQEFLDTHEFNGDKTAQPTTQEIDETFQDHSAASYAWFRRVYRA